ncbi:MAG TPA: aldo/keto reductase [Terriglobia bacterium]|jgi:D-threo-aldose 1-dehydrogenase|nr:aldo/keto reductase [Terriglobia bacterium]
MDPLEKVEIGRTGLRVTRLGLGGAPLGGLFQDVQGEDAVATVRRALEIGINFFDTAPLYGHGKSEIWMGKALANVPADSRVLATKVGRLLEPVGPGSLEKDEFDNPAPFKPVFDFSYDGVMRSFRESLKRLNFDRVEILHIHDPDNHFEQAIEGAYPALDQLRKEGRIKAVGAGMNQAEMLARFAREGNFDCFLLAGRYTLIDHTGLKELLPLCVEKGISIIIGGPYNSGVLATGARPGAKFNYADAPPEILDKVRVVEEICARHQVPMKAAALQFPLAHPAVVSVIPGARSVAELEENFRLIRQPIPAVFWADLRKAGIIPPEAPTPEGE